MNIVFENCEEFEIGGCEVNLVPNDAGDSIDLIEIKVKNYQEIKNWQRLLRRDVSGIELPQGIINVPYEDEKPGILGSQNKLESVTIDSECLCITIKADN